MSTTTPNIGLTAPTTTDQVANTIVSLAANFNLLDTKYPKTSVTGAKGGNVALANLITALAAIGLIVDNTT